MSATGFDLGDFPLLGTERRPATATEVAKAQQAAARRSYAAGSRDGAREMRLRAARLAEAKGCICWDLREDSCRAEIDEQEDPNGTEGSLWSIAEHDDRCPAALAEAIRRLPDGGEAPAEAEGESRLAGWGGGS